MPVGSPLAKKAPAPTIAEIYRYFHAEEQRHANAELALISVFMNVFVY